MCKTLKLSLVLLREEHFCPRGGREDGEAVWRGIGWVWAERGVWNGAGETKPAPVDDSVLSEGPESGVGVGGQETLPSFSFHGPYLKENMNDYAICNNMQFYCICLTEK